MAKKTLGKIATVTRKHVENGTITNMISGKNNSERIAEIVSEEIENSRNNATPITFVRILILGV